MNKAVLIAPLVAFLALSPAAAFAGATRLAVAGQKGGTLVLLDLGSRRNNAGKVEADGLLIFPAPLPPSDEAPVQTAPDHGRITLQFDCKARTIALTRMTILGSDNSVMKSDTPTVDPQAPVDPTDAHLLALACGEAFPTADKTFTDEKAALDAARHAK